MLRAILRFLLIYFSTFISGLDMIIFDNEEIEQVSFTYKKRKRKKDIEKDIIIDIEKDELINYLKRCNKKDKE